ncbi:type II toxin-antitoxin system RelE/ParE family toxin [Lonepinella sp. MS14437]|uniref:type II toxin-antitoxin system RelE family toxin n=1 Tax=Lonepinella sp. MS14437 TaxID=3003620 RepID=UPI0036D97F1D
MNSIWTVLFADSAKKQLTKLMKKNPEQAKRIISYLKEVSRLDDPTDRGKPLVGNLSGLWRYRIGDYRVICQINNNELIITTVDLGHRREIYH